MLEETKEYLVNKRTGNITRNNRTLVDNATAIFSTMTEAQKALVSPETMELYNEEMVVFPNTNEAVNSRIPYPKALP